MRIVIPQNLDRQDRKRLRQLIAELSKMSGAETFEEWQAFKKYHCREPHRADVVEQEITALMRGDVKRAHDIRAHREESEIALNAFWAEKVGA